MKHEDFKRKNLILHAINVLNIILKYNIILNWKHSFIKMERNIWHYIKALSSFFIQSEMITLYIEKKSEIFIYYNCFFT